MVKIIVYGAPERFLNYDRALKRAGALPCWTEEGARPEDCDALFLAGGGDIAPRRIGMEAGMATAVDEIRDEEELALLDCFLREGKPVLGVCRGVQMLNVALGGDLHQHIEGHNGIEGADRVHVVETVPDSRMICLCGRRAVVNSAHHQALRKLGKGLRITMRALDGTVEAVEHETLPVWGVQWHPERWTEQGGQQVYDLFVEETAKNICRKMGRRP